MGQDAQEARERAGMTPAQEAAARADYARQHQVDGLGMDPQGVRPGRVPGAPPEPAAPASVASGVSPEKGAPTVRLGTAQLLPAALRILMGSRRDKDWKGVSKAIWLLQELSQRSAGH